jgi:DNA-binding NarL/FixJ family response regulator
VDDGGKAVRRCQELGAKGLVLKGQEIEELVNAVRSVHAGQQIWGQGRDRPLGD